MIPRDYRVIARSRSSRVTSVNTPSGLNLADVQCLCNDNLVTSEDLDELLSFWETSLRNQNRSPRTIRSYLVSVRQFAGWCAAQGIDPELTRRNAEAFTASLLDGGKASGTASLRAAALRRFSAWCADEGEIQRDELAGLRGPKIDQRIVEHLTGDEIRSLLAACQGRTFARLRDTALVRFMHSTGARADEVVSMDVIDLQLGARSCVITRGKGGKGRRSGYGDQTAEALARYLRARRKHPNAERPELWLAGLNGRAAGEKGALTYSGLQTALGRRAEAAGLVGFHLHRLRHTCAVDWLRCGGTVPGLMSQCGWISVEMVNRYVEAANAELAVAEAHRLSIDAI
jgi:integrase/recombinase XerD